MILYTKSQFIQQCQWSKFTVIFPLMHKSAEEVKEFAQQFSCQSAGGTFSFLFAAYGWLF